MQKGKIYPERVEVRMTEMQKKYLEKGSKKRHLTINAFLRRLICDDAQKNYGVII